MRAEGEIKTNSIGQHKWVDHSYRFDWKNGKHTTAYHFQWFFPIRDAFCNTRDSRRDRKRREKTIHDRLLIATVHCVFRWFQRVLHKCSWSELPGFTFFNFNPICSYSISFFVQFFSSSFSYCLSHLICRVYSIWMAPIAPNKRLACVFVLCEFLRFLRVVSFLQTKTRAVHRIVFLLFLKYKTIFQ